MFPQGLLHTFVAHQTHTDVYVTSLCNVHINQLLIGHRLHTSNPRLPHTLKKVVPILVLLFENCPLLCSKTLTFQLKTTPFSQ